MNRRTTADAGEPARAIDDAPPAIDVRVHFFAQAREAVGGSEVSLRLGKGADVEEAARMLGARFPDLAPHLERCSFAVNEDYVKRDARLRDGDVLAVLPPIGGG